jgi:hypothetical protein
MFWASSDWRVSANIPVFDIPASHHSAIPTLRALPGSLAAAVSQSNGIGPFKNIFWTGLSSHFPVFLFNVIRFQEFSRLSIYYQLI